jgi:hypothetical protein
MRERSRGEKMTDLQSRKELFSRLTVDLYETLTFERKIEVVDIGANPDRWGATI